jgi:hypothetical protein
MKNKMPWSSQGPKKKTAPKGRVKPDLNARLKAAAPPMQTKGYDC